MQELLLKGQITATKAAGKRKQAKDNTNKIISVTIYAACGLIAKDHDYLGNYTTSDTYVKLYVDSNHKFWKTSTSVKTLNPVWGKGETFTVPLRKVRRTNTRMAKCHIFYYNRDTSDDIMGRALLGLP